MRKPTIELVSWDVDGTLYSGPAMRRWVLARLCRRPWGVIQLARTRRFHRATEASRATGGDVRHIRLASGRNETYPHEVAWCQPAIARAGLRPGVLTVLTAVRTWGYPQVAFSDYRADYKLEALGVRQYFDAIYAGEDLGFVKPNPSGFLAMAERYQVAPQAILHIGDREATDGRAAAAAGVHCLLLGRDVHHPAELLGRLRVLLRREEPDRSRR